MVPRSGFTRIRKIPKRFRAPYTSCCRDRKVVTVKVTNTPEASKIRGWLGENAPSKLADNTYPVFLDAAGLGGEKKAINMKKRRTRRDAEENEGEASVGEERKMLWRYQVGGSGNLGRCHSLLRYLILSAGVEKALRGSKN
ncbi:hypothetical protein F5146DRAFT_1010281 [Armillaria mellea]|nr:hypothetical protein F5146DRAFT_1010281 [Armillaria mellea]